MYTHAGAAEQETEGLMQPSSRDTFTLQFTL